MFGSVAKGAAGGGTAGASFGPYGAAIGAGIGAVKGGIDAKEQEEESRKQALLRLSQQFQGPDGFNVQPPAVSEAPSGGETALNAGMSALNAFGQAKGQQTGEEPEYLALTRGYLAGR